MRIYTKTGDAGSTALVGGTRVSKTHPRVAAYGEVDELISHIAVIRAALDTAKLSFNLLGIPVNDFLLGIQNALMVVAAHLASDESPKLLPALDPKETKMLEQSIDQMQDALPPLHSFILPGLPLASAQTHVARTVCRRAERSALAIGPTALAPEILAYLNRLSDFLFALGRYICHQAHVSEDYWAPLK